MYNAETKENFDCYKTKIITKQYNEINLSISIINSKLSISCNYWKNYIEKTFINHFSFDELKTISGFYRAFDNEEDILNEIIHNKSQKEIFIEGNEDIEDHIKLVIPIALHKYPKICFELNEKEKSLEENARELESAVSHYQNELIINNFNSKILFKKDREKHFIKTCISLNKKLSANLLCSFHDIIYNNNEYNNCIITVKDFHNICDNKEKILVICKSKNEIFGGYTPLSYNSSNEYRYDDESFLFSLNDNKYIKYSKNSFNKTESITCYKDYGPSFHDDLHFKKNTMNVIEFKRKNYLTPDNWVNINKCISIDNGILLDSLEIYQIKEEDKINDEDNNKDIDDDEINNNNKRNKYKINIDKNLIENKNLTKELKDSDNKEQKLNKIKEDEENKKKKENGKENIIRISQNSETQNELFGEFETRNIENKENKTFTNKMDGEDSEIRKESIHDYDEKEKEKEESEDDEI